MFPRSIEDNLSEIRFFGQEDFVFPEFKFKTEAQSDREVEDEPEIYLEKILGSESSPRIS